MIGKIIQCVVAGTLAAGGLVAAGSLPANAAATPATSAAPATIACPSAYTADMMAGPVLCTEPATGGAGATETLAWTIPGLGR